MNARSLACFGLFAVACVAVPLAAAGPVYEWVGTCSERLLSDSTGLHVLPCPATEHGILTMFDGYVPGTPFDASFVSFDAAVGFTFFDDAIGNVHIPSGGHPFTGLLPVEQGAGSLNIENRSENELMAISPTGWFFRGEIGSNSGLNVFGTISTFRLVSEPATLALVIAALLGLMGYHARNANQFTLQRRSSG